MVDKWLVETDLSDEWDFYTRANVGEVFPDPVAPLSFFYFQHDDPEGGRILGGSEMGFRNAYYRIGVMTPDELPDDQCVFLGITGGYAYLNASALRMLGHRAPNMTAKDIDDAFFGDAPGVPEFVVKPGFDRPDLTEKIAETFGWVLTTPNLPDVLEHERLVDGLHSSRPDLAAMSDAELIDHAFRLADAHFEMLFGEHIFVTFLATLPLGIITAVCNAVGQPTAVLKLLAGLGDVESAAPSMAMWDLGRMVVDSPSLTASFDTGYRGLHRASSIARTIRTLRRSSNDSPTSPTTTAAAARTNGRPARPRGRPSRIWRWRRSTGCDCRIRRRRHTPTMPIGRPSERRWATRSRPCSTATRTRRRSSVPRCTRRPCSCRAASGPRRTA